MNDEEFLASLAQPYLNEIKIMGKHWGGDMEMGAIADIYNCPIHVNHLVDNDIKVLNLNASGEKIELKYNGVHYAVIHNGQEHQVLGDGDCLFNACIQGYLLNTDSNHQFTESDRQGGEHSIASLREQVSARLDPADIIARYRLILGAETKEQLRVACQDLEYAPFVKMTIARRHPEQISEATERVSSSDDADLIADIREFHSDVLKFLALKLNVLGVTLMEDETDLQQLKLTDWQAQVTEVKKFIAAFVKPNLPENHHLNQAHKADMSAIYRQKVFSYEMKSAFLPELIELLEGFLNQAGDDKNFDALNDAVSEKLDSVTFRLMDSVVDALQRNLGAYYKHGKQYKVEGKTLEQVHQLLNQKPYEFSEELFGEDFQRFYDAMLASIKKEVDIYRETFSHADGVGISLDKLRLDQKSSAENEQILSEQHLAYVDKMESAKDLVNRRNRRRKANLAGVARNEQFPDELTKHVMAIQYAAHHIGIVDLLEDAPMPVDLQDGEGNTLLHMAHLLGVSEVAQFLEEQMLASDTSTNQHGLKPHDMRSVSAQMHYQMLPTNYHGLDGEVDIFSAVPSGLASMSTLRNSSNGLHDQLRTTYQARLETVEKQLNWPIIGSYLHDAVALQQRKEFARKLVSLMESKPFLNNQDRSRLVCQEIENYMQEVRGRFDKSPEKSQLYALLKEFLETCEYNKDQGTSLVSFRKYMPMPISREDMKLQLAQHETESLKQKQTIISLEAENSKQKIALTKVEDELQETRGELQETNVKLDMLMEWYKEEKSQKKDAEAETKQKYNGPGMY